MSILTHFAQTNDSGYTYSTQMTTGATTDSGPYMMVLAVFSVVLFIVAYTVGAYLLSRIFKKAGIPAWKAWIPVYNTWLLFELGGYAGWWAIVLMIPLAGLAAAAVLCLAYYRIGLGFGKSGAFVLLAIFFPIIWMAWLAFDTSAWRQAEQLPDSRPDFQPSQNQTPPSTTSNQ